jgi:glucans biosynthesis protein C
MKIQLPTPGRRNDLDRLRVLAILGVFVYHGSLVFAPDAYSIKNGTLYEFLDDWGAFGGTWGLPLVFIISGASAFYALGRVRPAKFLQGVVLRLVVPLLVGMLTHCALQVYLERLQAGAFRGSFFEFYPHYFEGLYGFGGNFAWMGMHLWYLELLFLFILLCLPLLAWLKNAPGGQRLLQGLGDFLARPGAIYLLALPAYILINVLDPDSLGADVLGDWSIFIYLSFFVSGFVIISHDGLQASIRRWRWVSLAAGVVLWGLIDPLWMALGAPTFGSGAFALGIGPWCLNAWCWLLAILGFGMKHLRASTPFVMYANEAVMPFYILHQTVLLSLAYFVVRWAIPDPLKFLAMLSGTFVIVMALYEFVVRRSNILRILFGMKPRPRPSAEPRALWAQPRS